MNNEVNDTGTGISSQIGTKLCEWAIEQMPKNYRVFEVGADGVQPLQVPHYSAREAGQGGAAKDGFVPSLQTNPLQEAVAALEHNLQNRKYTCV